MRHRHQPWMLSGHSVCQEHLSDVRLFYCVCGACFSSLNCPAPACHRPLSAWTKTEPRLNLCVCLSGGPSKSRNSLSQLITISRELIYLQLLRLRGLVCVCVAVR